MRRIQYSLEYEWKTGRHAVSGRYDSLENLEKKEAELLKNPAISMVRVYEHVTRTALVRRTRA